MSSAFLSRGSWTLEPATDAAGPLACRLRRRAHYSCVNVSVVRWSSGTPHCGGRPPPLLGTHTGNRTLWIMGDSTSYEVFVEAGCRLEAEADVSIEWRSPRWAWPTTQPDARTGRIHTCGVATSRRAAAQLMLCFVPAGGTGRYHRDGRAYIYAYQALRRLVELNLTSANDVALVNEGAWLAADDEPRFHFLAASLVAAVAAGDRARWPRVLYRECFAQHFPTEGGAYGRANRSNWDDWVTCPPLAEGVQKPRALRNVSATLRHGGRRHVEVLDAWELTRPLAASHPGRSSRVVATAGNVSASAALDCTHYCTWGGVNAALLDAVAWDM